jgi:hypothetical protein
VLPAARTHFPHHPMLAWGSPDTARTHSRGTHPTPAARLPVQSRLTGRTVSLTRPPPWPPGCARRQPQWQSLVLVPLGAVAPAPFPPSRCLPSTAVASKQRCSRGAPTESGSSARAARTRLHPRQESSDACSSRRAGLARRPPLPPSRTRPTPCPS